MQLSFQDVFEIYQNPQVNELPEILVNALVSLLILL